MPKRVAAMGMWEDEYQALLDAQGGKCAIPSCVARPVTRRFSVDHDHATGRIRGLLCHRHNRRLWAGATAGELREMADYLESAAAVAAPPANAKSSPSGAKDLELGAVAAPPTLTEPGDKTPRKGSGSGPASASPGSLNATRGPGVSREPSGREAATLAAIRKDAAAPGSVQDVPETAE